MSLIPQPIDILRIGFHPLTLEETITVVDRWLSAGKKFQITVSNVHSLMMSQTDPELRKNLRESDLLLSDSVPICWLSRALGKGLPDRVAGPDLCESLLKRADDEAWSVFFLGSSPEVLEKITTNLKKRFPGIRSVGGYSPPMRQSFSDEENQEMIDAVNRARPDIVFVGMTAGKHEKWIAQNFSKINCKITMGIGATFDFLAGTKKRAPLWMRNAGLEWFYRLCQEPDRLWKRYVYYNTIFMLISFREIARYWMTRLVKFALDNR